MNCANLRLTSNPIFLSRRSQTITRGESCTLTLGTWELARCSLHTHTHTQTRMNKTYTHLHTGSEVKLLIDGVIERFKIHLTSTVRQSLLSLEFNRLRQSSSWSKREVILILSCMLSSFSDFETVFEKFLFSSSKPFPSVEKKL